MNETNSQKARLLPPNVLLPFILLASCFMWWGIANNITDPLVKVFKEIFGDLTNFQASLIQFAFYGGYFCMAIPGGIIARKYSYKKGVLIGLGFYAVGCFMLYPATLSQTFAFFLLSYYVLACGLGILETNANPYILAIGDQATATRRLNFAQAFNPIGSLIGLSLCTSLIMAKLPHDAEGKLSIAPDQASEALSIVIFPYLTVASLLVVVWILIALTKMPKVSEPDHKAHFFSTFGHLLKNGNYLFAVIAQFFYVGAQITVWTYTNYYIPEAIGVPQEVALKWHMVAIISFGVFRWIFVFLMKFFKDHTLLLAASIIAALLTLTTVCAKFFIEGNEMFGYIGSGALVAISAFMSLMFPTIFGLGSRGLGDDTKVGAAGLIMAILGGALITPLQAFVIDKTDVYTSYLVPFVCFVVIAAYAVYAGKVKVENHPEAEAL